MKITLLIALLFIYSHNSLGEDYSKYDSELYVSTDPKNKEEAQERITKLDSIIKEIDEKLTATPEDAQLNYLKGRAIYAYIYTFPRPRTAQQMIEMKALGQEAVSWYQKAIEHDRGDLTVGQLYLLKGFDYDWSVKAIDKILKRDKRLIGEERQIVELKRSKVVALIKLGRFEDAENEVKALRNDYPDRFKESSVDYYKEEIVEAKKKIQSKKEEVPPITETIKEKKSGLSEAGEVDTSTKPVLD